MLRAKHRAPCLARISSTTAPTPEAFGPTASVSPPGTSTGRVLLASETSASHPMVDGVSRWVAVLALDQWGRHTSTFAVVEGVPLNNTELATTIDLTVLGDGSEADGTPWLVKEGAFSASAHLHRNGVPITNASLEATFTYMQEPTCSLAPPTLRASAGGEPHQCLVTHRGSGGSTAPVDQRTYSVQPRVADADASTDA